ncbi:hypothetical protein B0H15DRAFT_824087 [Mycena belliarum]|uniref:Histone H1 n=1 Tax=Mycena belliarum TaxID=1033014 RepID=A0AAD6UBL4_9AGAR|nr:hypothetical protein B0H15DRAFT_824087 [Mycena belliae]
MSSQTSASPAPSSASTPIEAGATTKAVAAKKSSSTGAGLKKSTTKKVATSKATPAHPTWKDIIKECIATSDAPKRQGVSRSAIKKFAEDKYKLSTPANISQLNRAIVSGVEAGIFIQPKGPSGCVKLAPSVKRDVSKENSEPASNSNPKSGAKVAMQSKPPTKAAKTTAAKAPVLAKKSAKPKEKTAVLQVGKKAAPSKAERSKTTATTSKAKKVNAA